VLLDDKFGLPYSFDFQDSSFIYLFGRYCLVGPIRFSLSLFSEEEENKKSNSRVVVIACQQQQTNIPHRSLSTVLVFSSAGRIKTKKNNFFFVFGPNDVTALTHGGGDI
jgi:hypothetical protein